MPTRDYRCLDCLSTVEKISKESLKLTCDKCKGNMKVVFLSAPNFSIAAKHTFDGKPKVSGKHLKDKPKVPINIIDEKPGGGYTVTTSDPSAAKDAIYGK